MQLQHLRPCRFRHEVKVSNAVARHLVNAYDVDRFVYITYNFGQALGFDRRYPAQAVYLRVLLRDLGMSNSGCDQFFSENSDILKEINEEQLLDDLLCQHFKAQNVKHLAVALDEVRCLLLDQRSATLDCTPDTLRSLGDLAGALEQRGVACTALVSSLTSKTFTGACRTLIHIVDMPKVTENAIDFSDQKKASRSEANPAK